MDAILPADGMTIPTVTPNPAIGRTLFVDALQPGRRNAVRDRLTTVTGKGVDASLVLAQWGAHSVALGFAAGDTGRLHDSMLAARGVTSDWVWVQGETRTNVVIVAASDRSVTTLSDDTLQVRAADEDALVGRFDAQLAGAQSAALGGPLPATASGGLYVRLLQAARRRGVPVVLDAVGPAAARWLEAGPVWIKPNRDELAQLAGRPLAGADDALAQAARIHAATGIQVLVSLDADGAVAAAGGCLWRILPLQLPLVSAEGAGDAMVAGLAVALGRNLTVEACLRLSAAAAAAALLQPRVGEADPADVRAFYPRIVVECLGGAHG